MPTTADAVEQHISQIGQQWAQNWNAGDLDRFDARLADDYVAEHPGMPGPQDKAANRMYLDNFLTAFPGSQFEVLRTVAEGDIVMQNWKCSGVNSGTLHSPSGTAIPPTGKTVVLTGSTTSQVRNGKIVREEFLPKI